MPTTSRPSRLFVIGASAGGFEALYQLLRELPENFPAPILLVIHVPIDSPGLTSAVLQKQSNMLVLTATDETPLKPGRVYVAPPNYHLVVDDSRMRLLSGPVENGHRPAIDPLFRSAASMYGRDAVGVILSGYLDDGVAGLHQIKQAGGITIVQDPDDASVPDMPQNAIDRVDPDHSVPMKKMASLMTRLAQEHFPVQRQKVSSINERSHWQGEAANPSVFTCPECHGTLWEETEGQTLKFRCRVGHAFTADTMLEDQRLDVERALWAALRVLEENSELSSRLAARARNRGYSSAMKRYEERAEEAKRNAKVLKELVTNRPQVPAPARRLEQAEEQALAD